MAKYKVKVTIKASCTYELIIDEQSENLAEGSAAAQWRDILPEGFQVTRSYIDGLDSETEQLTADCPTCGKEHKVPTAEDDGRNNLMGVRPGILTKACFRSNIEWWWDDSDYCAACGRLVEAENQKEYATA